MKKYRKPHFQDDRVMLKKAKDNIEVYFALFWPIAYIRHKITVYIPKPKDEFTCDNPACPCHDPWGAEEYYE